LISPYVAKCDFRTLRTRGWKKVLGNEVTASELVRCVDDDDEGASEDVEGREII